MKQIAKHLFFIFVLCVSFVFTSTSYAENNNEPLEIRLFPPLTKGTLSLEETLWKRKSVRSFTDETPSWKQIGQLLWSAQGINRPEEKHRTVPSAWGAYPLEIYVILPDGVYHYLPLKHSVVRVKTGNLWNQLDQVGFSPSIVYDSPCVFVICAEFEKLTNEYKADGKRYVLLEGGHAAHSICLQAISLGLGCVPNGLDLPEKACRILGVPERQKPIYILATGLPKEN